MVELRRKCHKIHPYGMPAVSALLQKSRNWPPTSIFSALEMTYLPIHVKLSQVWSVKWDSVMVAVVLKNL